MARTAPAPNVPPTPGMCPHLVVKAGGGAGGGSGGGGAGSGGGGSGGGPGGGGAGAGDGSPQAATASPNGHKGKGKGGCPIDFVTGEMFSFPHTDFTLPGPLPVRFVRQYRTGCAGRACGLGFGWWHSYAARFRLRDRHIDYVDGEGIAWRLPLVAKGDEVVLPYGRRLTRTRRKLVLTNSDGLGRVFMEASSGLFLLAEERDRHGNTVQLVHDAADTLCRIRDSVGRWIDRHGADTYVEWVAHAKDGQGHVHRRPLVRYEIDEAGQLAGVVDPLGARWSYHYDERHYLVQEQRPDGLRFHFRYARRPVHKRIRPCIETWGDLADRDILEAVGREAVEESAPSAERPRGIFHLRLEYEPESHMTVIDEGDGGTHRYHGNAMGLWEKYVDPRGTVRTFEYDDDGNVVAESDEASTGSTFAVDEAGQLVHHTDPRGAETRYHRDEGGRLVQVDDALGQSWMFDVDDRGNLLGHRDPLGGGSRYAYDARGQLSRYEAPDGDDFAVERDSHGNVVVVRRNDHVVEQRRFDLFGQLVEWTSPPSGVRRTYEYDANGDLIALDDHGRRTTLRRDGLRRIVEKRTPERATTRRYVGDALVESDFGSGMRFRMGYDSALRGLWVRNAAHETHWIGRDLAGLVEQQSTFANVTKRAWFSAASDLQRVRDSLGHEIAFERDELGYVTRVEHSDGYWETRERDLLGRLVVAANEHSRVTFRYDEAGRPVEETQEVRGLRFAVQRTFDAEGRVVRRSYSTGWSEELIYQGTTRPATRRVLEDGQPRDGATFHFDYDALGRERRRWRPALREEVVTELDGQARPSSVGLTKDAQPLRERTFQWSAAGPLLSARDSSLGEQTYELDALGRPTRLRTRDREETIRYSAHGTPMFGDAEIRVGPGGRILRDEHTEYRWDERGRLVEKRRVDGSRTWHFAYEGPDRLRRLRSSDGQEVEHVYDALGRRLLTEVGDRVIWHGWDGDHAVEEVDSERGLRRRLFSVEGLVPLAERDAHGAWHHLLTDAAGTPWAAVDPAGQCRDLELSTFGRSVGEAPTRLRFLGQQADEWAGLHYHRHRYYDPAIAQFISPDPQGLSASFQDVGFVLNPTIMVDPFGAKVLVTMSDDPNVNGWGAGRRRSGDVYLNESDLGTEKARQAFANDDHVELWTHGRPGAFEGRTGKQLGEKLRKSGFKGGHIDLMACDGGTPYKGNRSGAHDLADATGATVTAARGHPGSPPSGKVDPLVEKIVHKEDGMIDYDKPGGYWETVGPKNQEGLRPKPSWGSQPDGYRDQKPPGWDPNSGGGTLVPDPITDPNEGLPPPPPMVTPLAGSSGV